MFIFKKYRGQKLCTLFISHIRNTAPVEDSSLFVVSVMSDNIPAIRCYKRAEFIDIDPSDVLAHHFNEYWKTTNLKHMIISRKSFVPDNDKLNAKIKKLMKEEFGISNEYVTDMIYLIKAAGIIAKGPGILNIRFLKSFGEHFKKSIRPEITEAYIFEIIYKRAKPGPIERAVKAGRYPELQTIDPQNVIRVHKQISDWAWEVAPL